MYIPKPTAPPPYVIPFPFPTITIAPSLAYPNHHYLSPPIFLTPSPACVWKKLPEKIEIKKILKSIPN